MSAFPHFFGNEAVAQTLLGMVESGRVAQTILLSGPEGVGKATLARRFAAALLQNGADKIEKDDLSLPANQDVVTDREKWTADKRNEDPLLFSTHPDFMTFAPDGPLRQITIQQMRLLRERAPLKPLRGRYRVVLIDHLQRANEQAANSLLKVLEEPPEHLVILGTAENLYDLLPTIRSRSLVLQLARLSDSDMFSFADGRDLPDRDARVALAEGCPGIAATLDLQVYRERRALMLAAFECGAHVIPFSQWISQSESFSSRKSEKLDFHLKIGYGLLEDLLSINQNRNPGKNRDVERQLRAIADRIEFSWLQKAASILDELVSMVRRNIQKTSALDSLVVKLRNPSLGIGA